MKFIRSKKNQQDQDDKGLKQGFIRTKCFVIIAITSVIVYKIAMTPIDLTIDFPTLLSLLLAFFSVGLAAMFYFKATESSNTFYDNTYKFTQDIASLLVKIESGFGEKLRHLDEGYTSMRDKIDGFPKKYEIEDTKTEIKKEEKELQKMLEEKNNLIEELALKAHLGKEEKNNFKTKLDSYIEELNKAQKEITFLKNRLKHAEHVSTRKEGTRRLPGRLMFNYIRKVLFSMIPVEFILENNRTAINKKFQHVKDDLSQSFIRDLKSHGMLTPFETLTGEGVAMLKEIAEDYLSNS